MQLLRKLSAQQPGFVRSKTCENTSTPHFNQVLLLRLNLAPQTLRMEVRSAPSLAAPSASNAISHPPHSLTLGAP